MTRGMFLAAAIGASVLLHANADTSAARKANIKRPDFSQQWADPVPKEVAAAEANSGDALLDSLTSEVPLNTTLNIVNGLLAPLVLVEQHSQGVKDWQFSDVPAANGIGEFSTKGFNVWPFDGEGGEGGEGGNAFATATYNVGGDPTATFTIVLAHCKEEPDGTVKEGSCVQVKAASDLAERFMFFPHHIVGFEAGQTMDFVIAERILPVAPTPEDEKEGLRWMERTADFLADLTWVEMTLACTHDTGTYDPEFVLGIPYSRNQYLPVIDQLRLGIRVLDVRVGWRNGEWIITHGSFAMSYNVETFLAEVKMFIDETPREIVMLDFHNFNIITPDPAPDLKELKAFIFEKIEGYILPHDKTPAGLDSPMRDLWAVAGDTTARMMISWNPPMFGEPDDWMWPALNQKWFNTAEDIPTLDKQITEFLGVPIHGTEKTTPTAPFGDLYSICVFTNNLTPLEYRAKLLRDSHIWMHGSDNWSLTANVIAQDFVPHATGISKAGIVANIIKGTQRNAGLPLGPLS